jgi:hypothetical protein
MSTLQKGFSMSAYRSVRRPTMAVAVLATAALAAVLPFAAPASADATKPNFTKVKGAAVDAAGLTPTVNKFRALLGEPNNGSGPPAQTGRREINWDGTPDAQSAPNLLLPDFFNTVVPRGAVFASGAGNKFQVSADDDNPTRTGVRFANLNGQFDDIFATFSPQRLFTPLGTNRMTVKFFVPGTDQRATVKGFGAVFTDVDDKDSTKIELYDRKGKRIWWSYAPKGPKSSRSLSFLGVKTTADVYEVRITAGDAPLNAKKKDKLWRDLVAMDDFLYAEPQRLK